MIFGDGNTTEWDESPLDSHTYTHTHLRMTSKRATAVLLCLAVALRAVGAIRCNVGSCDNCFVYTSAYGADRCTRHLNAAGSDAPCCTLGPGTASSLSNYEAFGYPAAECFGDLCFPCPTPANPCPLARNATSAPSTTTTTPPSSPPTRSDAADVGATIVVALSGVACVALLCA